MTTREKARRHATPTASTLYDVHANSDTRSDTHAPRVRSIAYPRVSFEPSQMSSPISPSSSTRHRPGISRAARQDGSDGDASKMTHAQSGTSHEAPYLMKSTFADDDFDIHDRAAAVRAGFASFRPSRRRMAVVALAIAAKRGGMVAKR